MKKELIMAIWWIENDESNKIEEKDQKKYEEVLKKKDKNQL